MLIRSSLFYTINFWAQKWSFGDPNPGPDGPSASLGTWRSPRGSQARPRRPRPNMSRRHPAAWRSDCWPRSHVGTGGHGAMEDHGDMRIVEWKKRESSREWMGISGLLGLSLVLDHSQKFPMFSTSKTDREGTNLKSLFFWIARWSCQLQSYMRFTNWKHICYIGIYI